MARNQQSENNSDVHSNQQAAQSFGLTKQAEPGPAQIQKLAIAPFTPATRGASFPEGQHHLDAKQAAAPRVANAEVASLPALGNSKQGDSKQDNSKQDDAAQGDGNPRVTVFSLEFPNADAPLKTKLQPPVAAATKDSVKDPSDTGKAPFVPEQIHEMPSPKTATELRSDQATESVINAGKTQDLPPTNVDAAVQVDGPVHSSQKDLKEKKDAARGEADEPFDSTGFYESGGKFVPKQADSETTSKLQLQGPGNGDFQPRKNDGGKPPSIPQFPQVDEPKTDEGVSEPKSDDEKSGNDQEPVVADPNRDESTSDSANAKLLTEIDREANNGETKDGEENQSIESLGQPDVTAKPPFSLGDVPPWAWALLLLIPLLLGVLALRVRRKRRKRIAAKRAAQRAAAAAANAGNRSSNFQHLADETSESETANTDVYNMVDSGSDKIIVDNDSPGEDFNYLEDAHDDLANQSLSDEEPETNDAAVNVVSSDAESDERKSSDAVFDEDNDEDHDDEYARQFERDFRSPEAETLASEAAANQHSDGMPRPSEPALELASHDVTLDEQPDSGVVEQDEERAKSLEQQPVGTDHAGSRYALADDPFAIVHADDAPLVDDSDNTSNVASGLMASNAGDGTLIEDAQGDIPRDAIDGSSDGSSDGMHDGADGVASPGSMYAELQAELLQVRQLMEQAQREREEVNERFESLREKAEASEQQKKELAESLRLEKERADDLEESFDNEVGDLSDAKAELEQERDQLKQEIETSALEAEKARAELEVMIAAEKEAKVAEFEKKIADLEGSLQETSLVKDQVESSYAEEAEAMAATIARLGSVESEKDTLASKVDEFEKELSTAKEEIAATETRLAETASSLSEKERLLEENDRKLAEAVERSSELESVAGSSSTEVETLKQSHDELQQQIDALNSQVETEQTQRNELVAVKAEHESSIASLTNQIAEAHLERDESKKKIDEIETELESVKTERERLATLVANAELETASQAEKLQSLEKSIEEVSSEKEQLTNQLTELKTKQEAEQSSREQEKSASEERDGTLEKLRAELEEKRRDVVEKTNKLGKQEAELIEVRQAIQARAEADAAEVDAQSQVAVLETQLREASEKSQELEEEVNRLSALQNEQALHLFEEGQKADQEALKLSAEELKAKSEKNDVLQIELERTSMQLREQVEAIDQHESDKRILQETLDGILEERDQLQASFATVQTQFEEAQSRAEELAAAAPGESEKREAEEQLEKQRIALEQFENEKQELQNQLTYAKRDHDIALSERNRLVKELAAEQEAMLALKSDLRSAGSASDLLSGDNTKLQQELRELRTKRTQLEQEVDQLRTLVTGEDGQPPRLMNMPRLPSMITGNGKSENGAKNNVAFENGNGKKKTVATKKPKTKKAAEKKAPTKTASTKKAKKAKAAIQKDDLTELQGVGPALQDRLYERGFYSYEQLMSLEKDQMLDLTENVPGITAPRLKQIKKLAGKMYRSR